MSVGLVLHWLGQREGGKEPWMWAALDRQKRGLRQVEMNGTEVLHLDPWLKGEREQVDKAKKIRD